MPVHDTNPADWRVRLGEKRTVLRETQRRYEVRWPCGRVAVVKGVWSYYMQGKAGWLAVLCDARADCYSDSVQEVDPATPLSDTKGDHDHAAHQSLGITSR